MEMRLILLFVMSVEVSPSNIMLKKIWTDMKEILHQSRHLNRLFRTTLPSFHCVQVETDGSPFSLSFLEYLHESNDIPPLVNGGKWLDTMGCNGFIILAANYSSSRSLLERTPRYATHRIIVIIKGIPAVALNDAIMGGVDIYRDADVVLVASSDLTSGYYMAQPKRYFTRFIKPKKWTHNEKGPSDFMGREIRAMTYNCTIFSKASGHLINGRPRFQIGVELKMFEDIAERLNLIPKYKPGVTGKKNLWFMDSLRNKGNNGSDIAFCGILMSAKKMSRFVSMSVPETLICLRILVPRPIPVSREWDGVFHPFEPQLWSAISLFLLITTFVLQRFSWSSAKYSKAPKIRKYKGLGGSFMQLLSILVMTDVPKSSTSQGPLRHLITWWALFSMILTTCFSSGLISHLTKQEYTKKPNTIEELVKKKYSWAMEYTPDFSELLNLGNKWQVQWKHRFKTVKSQSEHIKLIRKEKQALWGYYAFGGFALPNYELPESIMKNYEAVNNCFMEYFIGFALREGSPFEQPINKYIQTYVEAGLIQALFHQEHIRRYMYQYKYVYQVLRPTKSMFAGPDGLELEQLFGIFLVWGIGIALSIAVFLLELAQKFWI